MVVTNARKRATLIRPNWRCVRASVTFERRHSNELVLTTEISACKCKDWRTANNLLELLLTLVDAD